jgi:pyruvate kinase
MIPKRKTKIVATVGPACNSREKLSELILSGVDVFRLNFSHGRHEDHKQVIDHIVSLNEEMDMHISILADLQGPKLRTGLMQNNAIELTEGKSIKVTNDEVIGTREIFSVTYDHLSKDLHPGEFILIDDGKIELQVEEILSEKTIQCKVISGGTLSSKKGFNLPNTKISLPSLTEKDHADLHFILTQPVNWIALSFVRTANDIAELRDLLHKHNSHLKIVAKIEKPEAVKNIDSIIKMTDAVMIARGDLGVEIAMEEMPLIQKKIIRKCIEGSKPVILATQVMESMIEMSRPTRAEITDVANGVFDGTDAIMLSGETSVGKHPARVVQTIAKIIRRTEQEETIYEMNLLPDKRSKSFISDAICFNACKIAADVSAKAINGMTYSGYTAFMLASNRPRAAIHIFTSNRTLLNTLSLVWGVDVFYYDKFVSTDESIDDIIAILKEKKLVAEGDIIVSTASMPIRGRGKANMIKISKIK